jgi:hypothetical protein
MNAIFLSASIPTPGREFYGTADPLQIQLAIRALLALALGRRHIVFGGHPSITPMIAAACDGLGLQFLDSVTLYQSRFYAKDFPEHNQRFGNKVLVEAGTDAKSSLESLRRTMFAAHNFEGAVFVGGMKGVLDEYELFHKMHPSAAIVPVAQTGAAAAALSKSLASTVLPHSAPANFTQLYIDALRVSPVEIRLGTHGSN